MVKDHRGQKLAYVYFEDESGRRAAASLLTKGEARRSSYQRGEVAGLAEQRCRCAIGGRTVPTHHDLWAGVDLKLDNARFHLESMNKALEPTVPLPGSFALLASTGAIAMNDWHRPFYAHLDAFLSAARSVPAIIRCCFGVDDGNRTMKNWFADLDPEEKARREKFDERFNDAHKAFQEMPLGIARNISEHRTGFAPVSVKISGRFGVTYTGDATTRLPLTEVRPPPDDLGWMPSLTPVQPRWTDFDIDGAPLFAACNDYVARVCALIEIAHAKAQEVHGNCTLTSPPNEVWPRDT